MGPRRIHLPDPTAEGTPMSHQPHDVLVGAYQDLEAAKRDFDAVTALVKARKVKVEGVILVEHHEDGDVSVVSTGDHMGRHGLGWGGGVGLVVGLLQPQLLAAVAVGAAGGAAIGKFADHRLKSGLGEKIGEALPLGGAGIIAVARSEDRLAIEQAMPGTPAKSVVADRRGRAAAAAEGLARRGDAQVRAGSLEAADPRPDVRRASPDGRCGTPSADWSMIPGPEGARGRAERPARPHRRRGLRCAGHVRRSGAARRTTRASSRWARRTTAST